LGTVYRNSQKYQEEEAKAENKPIPPQDGASAKNLSPDKSE